MVSDNEVASFEAFQDSLSTSVIARLAPHPVKGSKRRAVKGRKTEIKPVAKIADGNAGALTDGDAAELSDFVEYLAEEIFTSLPADLRSLSYTTVQDDASLKERYAVPLETILVESIVDHLPPTTSESLITYGLINDSTGLDRFIEPVLESYISTATSPPPEYTPELTATRPDGCEICDREHLPLTYHHLIPRQVHAKTVKRGWHKDWELNKVAWLCRACHSYVHKVATNEELAKELYSIDLLTEREDVQKWANWVGRVRWKAR